MKILNSQSLNFITKTVTKFPFRGQWLLFVFFFYSASSQVLDPGVRLKTFPLRGALNEIVPGALAETRNTDYFADLSANPRTIDTTSIRNILTFQLNESSTLYLKTPFTAKVKYRLYFAGKNDVLDSLAADQELNISYDTATAKGYNAKNSFTFNGGYTVRIKIVSITHTAAGWDPLPALELLNIMEYKHAYKFDCAAHTITGFQTDLAASSTDELLVKWTQLAQADEYDLEWAFIDSSAYANNRYGIPGSAQFNQNVFINNATRVSLTDTFKTYRIPLFYDGNGYIISRVRAVQNKPSQQRIEANWSTPITYNFNGHERNLNWQSTTSFAEEGKRKSVVQYFDGSLRGRQTVTKDNSTNTTVVAESIYDYQGRPSIQVMPAPTIKTMIGYTPNFTSLNNRAYDRTNFDSVYGSRTVCDAGADSMSNISGAAQYYSPNNPLKDVGFHKYIPDAKGYPFSETEYLQDGTGRVSRQGGVGPTFQLGSGHETKYYYGNPDQTELDALFGTEVGYANHYFKNMVRDANGQYSVNYLDMNGRTIATALAGDLPDSIKLDYLDSKKDTLLTKVLTDSTNNIIKGLTIESSKGMVVTKAGNNIFHYSLLPDTLNIKDCNQQDICYDCVYDLQVTITDDCNNKQFNGKPLIISRTNLSIGALDISCTPNTALGIDTMVFLNEGSYTVTKKLTVSNYALNYYLDSVFSVRNLCKTVDTFIKQQKQVFALRNPNCIKDCATCKTALGAWPAFKANYAIQNGISPYTPADTLRAFATYNKLLANCDVNCEKAKLLNEVDAKKNDMLQDLMPPNGQYANPNNIDALSIFNTTSVYSYTRAVVKYKDETGKLDTLIINGQRVLPNALSQADFIKYFKRSWANDLFITSSHPEYCKWVRMADATTAGVGRASYDWDQEFINTDTYAAALANGYLNPTGNAAFTNLYATTFPVNATKVDPFFAKNASYKTQMETAMRRYFIKTTTPRDTMSIWSIASAGAACPEVVTNTCRLLHKANPFNPAICNGEFDMAWRNFKGLYHAKKQQLLRTLIQTACNPALSTHFSHFPDVIKTITDSLGIDPTRDPNLYTETVKTKRKESYKRNCESYANIWWSNLAPCTTQKLYADSANIVRDLITICIKGSDSAHMVGSSSISPDSTNGTLKTFDDVIAKYVTAWNIANPTDTISKAVCNSKLIPFPTPYDKPVFYGDKPIYTKPDSCECAGINKLYMQYGQQNRYNSFATYVKAIRGAVMTNGALDSLRNLCNGVINCKYIAKPISLPPALQCKGETICVSCEQIGAVYSQFLSDYPNEHLLANDTLRFRYDSLLTSYMNQKLGYNKQTSEYYDFLTRCKIPYYYASTTAPVLQGLLLNNPVNGTANIASVRCDTLNNIINDFKATYPNVQEWNLATVRRKRTIYPVIEYQLGCPGISGKGPNFRTVSPQTFRAGALRDSAYGSKYFRHLIPFIKFDFFPLPRKMNVDSGIVYLSPILSQQFSPNFSYANITTAWDTNTTCASTGSIFFGFSVSSYTPQYQYTSAQNNPVYAYNFTLPYKNFVKFPTSHIGNLLAGFLNPATDSLISQTFIASANPLAKTDPETAPRSVITYRVDSIYSCRDLFAAYANARLNTKLSYYSLDSLYQAKCGVAMQVVCLPPSDSATLCGGNVVPKLPPFSGGPETPCDDSLRFSIVRGMDLYTVYKDSVLGEFKNRYIAKCLSVAKKEQFTVDQPVSEYHYTLYYYDQADNLVRTVPPKGVKPNYNAAWLQSVANARKSGTVVKPSHELYTNYRFNGLNKPVSQRSPDGGKSEFWYDRLTRLVVSQNAKQKAEGNNYSYTKYDNLGRITEAGQINGNTALLNDSITRRNNLLNTWFTTNNTKRQQITNTYYDQPAINLGVFLTQNKNNMRNWVSYTTFTKGNNPANYDYGTFYNYDMQGNVKELLMDYGASSMMGLNNQRFKKIVYEYDLINGKINKVLYQPPYFVQATQTWVTPTDAFHHRYKYDAQNRLTDVFVSSDGVNWDRDAQYTYYKNGFLARSVIGENRVQGTDYTFTLQGWMKGVNGTVIDSTNDIGQDGLPLNHPQGADGRVKDEVAYSLSYFDNDYAAINAPDAFTGLTTQLKTNTAYRPLFNGNISSVALNIAALNNSSFGTAGGTRLYNYKYDQLNRIKEMDVYKGNNAGKNLWSNGLILTQEHRERVTYDGNGNILTYTRNGDARSLTMDNLSYNYIVGSNQLTQVTDAGITATPADYNDIKTQGVNNYAYDAIGNMTQDIAGGINANGIQWSVYNKILQITQTKNAVTKTIQFTYDAAANRVSKTFNGITTWYVRGSNGNVIASYLAGDNTINGGRITWGEQHLYGNSRMGIYKSGKDLTISATSTSVGNLGSGNFSSLTRNIKLFELPNWTGNIIATISDKKVGIDKDNNGQIDYYKSTVLSASDYYPFGMPMPGRNFSSSTYRFGFNGKENDNETSTQDYGFRIYDPRVSRFLSVDPITRDYPGLTPYQFASNRPIDGVDLDGLEWYYYSEAAQALKGDGWVYTHINTPPMIILNDEQMNKLGYFSAAQVHSMKEAAEKSRKQQEEIERINALNDAAYEYQKSRNLLGILYKLSPAETGLQAYDQASSGNYKTAALLAGAAVTDIGPLFRTFGKGYAAVARDIAGKFSYESTWKLGSFARGAILEAKYAAKLAGKGFDWLAETISPFARTIDFYNKAEKLAISLKTVNAEKTFTFDNIAKNIEELQNLKLVGKYASHGTEHPVKAVQLHIAIPKGYDQKNLSDILIKARKALGDENVHVFELHD